MSIHKELGLDESKKYNFTTMLDILERFRKAQGTSASISTISFFYYIDVYGDFTRKLDRHSRLVKEMFDRLDIADKFKIKDYIKMLEEHDNAKV